MFSFSCFSQENTFLKEVINSRGSNGAFISYTIKSSSFTGTLVTTTNKLREHYYYNNIEKLKDYQNKAYDILSQKKEIEINSEYFLKETIQNRVVAVKEIDSLSKRGKDVLMNFYFNNKGEIKECIINRKNHSKTTEIALINKLFQWKIATRKDYHTGRLYIDNNINAKVLLQRKIAVLGMLIDDYKKGLSYYKKESQEILNLSGNELSDYININGINTIYKPEWMQEVRQWYDRIKNKIFIDPHSQYLNGLGLSYWEKEDVVFMKDYKGRIQATIDDVYFNDNNIYSNEKELINTHEKLFNLSLNKAYGVVVENIKHYKPLLDLMRICKNEKLMITNDKMNFKLDSLKLSIIDCKKIKDKEYYITKFDSIKLGNTKAKVFLTDGDGRKLTYIYQKINNRWLNIDRGSHY